VVKIIKRNKEAKGGRLKNLRLFFASEYLVENMENTANSIFLI